MSDALEQYPVVAVVWHDAVHTVQAWCTPADAAKLTTTVCRTVGLLVRETDEALFVTRSVNDIGDLGGVLAIPKGCIVDWGTLNVKFGKTLRRKN